MARKTKSEFPYRLEDRTSTIQSAIIAIEATFQAVRAVYAVRFPEPRIIDGTIVLAHTSPDREAAVKASRIYYTAPTSPELLKTVIASIRKQALEVGATPEAVRLLGSLEPWTKKEEATLAEKLKAKASRAKPDTEGLKTAAKAAPVSGNSAPKKRGNADALAKARAAKSTGPDNRKIKANIKAKDIKARPGTFRHKMVSDLLNSKTVDEFRKKDPKYDAGCLRYAQEAGIVSVA